MRDSQTGHADLHIFALYASAARESLVCRKGYLTWESRGWRMKADIPKEVLGAATQAGG